MKAMIFAAGLGTRLKPYTETLPKALVPVGGIPMLEIIIENFKRNGITEIIINVHHFASQVIEFLRKNNNFGELLNKVNQKQYYQYNQQFFCNPK